jgi:hypothetical protein
MQRYETDRNEGMERLPRGLDAGRGIAVTEQIGLSLWGLLEQDAALPSLPRGRYETDWKNSVMNRKNINKRIRNNE